MCELKSQKERREKMSQKRIVEEIIDENFQYSGERT